MKLLFNLAPQLTGLQQFQLYKFAFYHKRGHLITVRKKGWKVSKIQIKLQLAQTLSELFKIVGTLLQSC